MITSNSNPNPLEFNEFGTPPGGNPAGGNSGGTSFDWNNAFSTIANILFGPKNSPAITGSNMPAITKSDSTKWIVYLVSGLLVAGIITALIIVLKKK